MRERERGEKRKIIKEWEERKEEEMFRESEGERETLNKRGVKREEK